MGNEIDCETNGNPECVRFKAFFADSVTRALAKANERVHFARWFYARVGDVRGKIIVLRDFMWGHAWKSPTYDWTANHGITQCMPSFIQDTFEMPYIKDVAISQDDYELSENCDKWEIF